MSLVENYKELHSRNINNRGNVDHESSNSRQNSSKTVENVEKPSKTVGNYGRKWVFTYNNYSDVGKQQLLQKLHSYRGCRYIFGYEIAPTTGTPHLQGYVEFETPRSKYNLIKFKPDGHELYWATARKAKDANISYCTKTADNFESNFPEVIQAQILSNEYKDVTWKHFQQEIIDLLKEKPNSRTINWYWEPNGNTGKSYLAKYLAMNDNVVIASGKRLDVFYQVNTLLSKGISPHLILIDCVRTDTEFFNYGTIEQLKNGLLYSGKYEGGKCIFPHPHVVIFANNPPDVSAFSRDRWNIVQIT